MSAPENLARFLEMLGERDGPGLYGWPVMTATLREHPGQWFPLEVLNTAQLHQLQRHLSALDTYPHRYVARMDETGTGMVEVRAVTDTGDKPAPIPDDRAQQWEVDPETYFAPPPYVGPPRPNVDYLPGSEHDPNL